MTADGQHAVPPFNGRGFLPVIEGTAQLDGFLKLGVEHTDHFCDVQVPHFRPDVLTSRHGCGGAARDLGAGAVNLRDLLRRRVQQLLSIMSIL